MWLPRLDYPTQQTVEKLHWGENIERFAVGRILRSSIFTDMPSFRGPGEFWTAEVAFYRHSTKNWHLPRTARITEEDQISFLALIRRKMFHVRCRFWGYAIFMSLQASQSISRISYRTSWLSSEGLSPASRNEYVEVIRNSFMRLCICTREDCRFTVSCISIT